MNGVVVNLMNGIYKRNRYEPSVVEVLSDQDNKKYTCNIIKDKVSIIETNNPFDNKIIIFDEVHKVL